MNAVAVNPLEALSLGSIRPDYALTPAQYSARVISVAVYPIMEGGRVCLCPANDAAEAALERVRSVLERLAPDTAQDRTAWAVLKVRELLERINAVPEFTGDDVWYGTLGDQPIIVVKQGELEARQMTLDEAVRRVHRNLVATALQKGLPVPGEVAREHQLGLGTGAERELQ